MARTFNYHLTHRVIPKVMFSNLDKFYNNVLAYPDNLEHFMKIITERVTQQVKNDPDVEPAFSIESFEISFYGEQEAGVICVEIPNCSQMLDCAIIAFPSVREIAGYFTCEYSVNPTDNNGHFVLGGWKIENGNFSHQNWGKIDGGS